MKTYVKVLTLVLGILSMFLAGITLINLIWNESYLLFLYDLENGFTDNKIYVAAFIVLILLIIIVGKIYWHCISGKIHVRIVINTICIVAIGVCIYVNRYKFFMDLSPGTWEPTKTIGHSFGAVNGDDYTGSLEAFAYNYALGRRTMEVDLLLTTDDKLVLKHEWDEPKQHGISETAPPSEEQFLNTKILGKYTPVSFTQLCEIMEEHSDLWIVTDTKSTEVEEIKKQFGVMIETVRQLGCEEILDRIIVQVYNEEMYEIVDSIYHFKNYIFTMYWRFDNDDWLGITRDVCRFCVNNGIETITIGTNRISPEMKAITDYYGRNVYIHTVNDMESAEKYFKMGVNGIYTDILLDQDL